MTELQLQAQMSQWFWNTFPGHRQRLHLNDNNSFNSIEGARKKALGVVRGVTDFEFMLCDGRVLWIEVKLPGEKQSDKQIEFQQLCWNLGHTYIVIYSFEEFKELIYGALGDNS